MYPILQYSRYTDVHTSQYKVAHTHSVAHLLPLVALFMFIHTQIVTEESSKGTNAM